MIGNENQHKFPIIEMFHRNNLIFSAASELCESPSFLWVCLHQNHFPFSLRPNLGLIKSTLLYQSHSQHQFGTLIKVIILFKKNNFPVLCTDQWYLKFNFECQQSRGYMYFLSLLINGKQTFQQRIFFLVNLSFCFLIH